MSIQLENVLSILRSLNCNPTKISAGYSSKCPAHNDKIASLSISDGIKGVILKCHAGCDNNEILPILNLDYSDLFYNIKNSKLKSDKKPPLPFPSSQKETKSACGAYVKRELSPSKSESSQSFQTSENKVQDNQKNSHSVSNLQSNTEDDKTYSSKREYANLADYARFKGISETIFNQAGWSDTLYGKRKAIKISFPNGLSRYRLLDNQDSAFIQDKGFKKCWYKLDQAIQIAKDNNQSLIICNGEASTVIGQYYKLPTTAIAASESVNLTDELIQELSDKYNGKIYLALDNDKAGNKGSEKRLKALIDKGFDVQIIRFTNKFKGYDLADFCKDNNILEPSSLYTLLLSLIYVKEKNPQDEESKEFTVKKEPVSSLSSSDLPANFNEIFSTFRTDLGSAYHFVNQHGHNVKYCHIWKTWLYWDGKKWIEDHIGEIFRKGLLTIISLIEYADQIEDDNERKSYYRYITESQGKGKLNNMIEVAKNAPSIFILPEQFDQNHYILNCQNGILDLLTGQLSPHQSNQYLTKIVIADYDPKATCPIWLSFLNKIMGGNQNLVKYLQKAIGYSLTGNTMEKALFFFYGAAGDNGKSTFLETIGTILGSYCLPKFPANVLLDNQQNSTSNNPSPYIAQLCGARFVTASELSGNKKLNEENVKDLAGGIDTIIAKRLYQDPFTFKPTHKIFMFGNERPYIPRNSNATWNRLKTVPFEISIAKAEQDKDLPYKLLAEKEGILAWAVQGCLEWRKEGLEMPDEIKQANEDYRSEMDSVKHFLDEECFIDRSNPSCKIQKMLLYELYRQWNKRTGQNPLNERNFSKELKSHHFELHRGTAGYYYWQGIASKTDKEIESLKNQIKQSI